MKLTQYLAGASDQYGVAASRRIDELLSMNLDSSSSGTDSDTDRNDEELPILAIKKEPDLHNSHAELNNKVVEDITKVQSNPPQITEGYSLQFRQLDFQFGEISSAPEEFRDIFVCPRKCILCNNFKVALVCNI
jgi:hypothetical protein